jgi:CDP-6-deoxy-D-xylo-4-hexulose-3-dehydrase
MIPLIKNTISNEEIDSLIDWLKKYPRLTKGDLTIQFEKKWSEYLGVEYSIFVNSGSSANLLMIYYLIEEGLLKIGDSVIVPSLSWATTLAPVIQFGLKPILCDCNLTDLSIDIDHFQSLIKEHKPKCLMMVPILGFVPDMDVISSICEKENIILLEDTCESLGSEYKGKKLGNFGLMSSFSTYFGHHISTIEGGMICTNDKKVANILRALRSHGWDRDMDFDFASKLRKEYKTTDFNSLYTFYYTGFNVRSTDLQAYLGINQLERLPDIVKKRNDNFKIYNDNIREDIWKPLAGNKNIFISNFSYPVISKNRNRLVENLKIEGIECRPLLSGSLSRQPYWYNNFENVNLKNCDLIHDNGLYVPNNHEMSEKDIKKICNVINEFH